MATLYS